MMIMSPTRKLVASMLSMRRKGISEAAEDQTSTRAIRTIS